MGLIVLDVHMTQEESDKPLILPSSVDLDRFVEARSKEITKLKEDIIARKKDKTKRSFQTLPRHMRRRSQSHNLHRVPVSIRAWAEKEFERSKPNHHPPGRAKRRFTKHLLHPKHRWEREFDARSLTPTKVLTLDKSKYQHLLKASEKTDKQPKEPLTYSTIEKANKGVWLPTHVWHAKRFFMRKRWGYMLATEHHQKSFKAIKAALTGGCAIHDASYLNTIGICGDAQRIIQVINAFVPLLTLHASDSLQSILLSEKREIYTTLYHPNLYPYGAIGQCSLIFTTNSVHTSFDSTSESAQVSTSDQLLVCIHPTVRAEFLDALFVHIMNTEGLEIPNEQIPRIKQADPSMSSPSRWAIGSLQVVDYRRHFCRFQLRGPLSLLLLQSCLNPFIPTDLTTRMKNEDGTPNPAFQPFFGDAQTLKEQADHWHSLFVAPNASYLPPNSVIPLRVVDPRFDSPQPKLLWSVQRRTSVKLSDDIIQALQTATGKGKDLIVYEWTLDQHPFKKEEEEGHQSVDDKFPARFIKDYLAESRTTQQSVFSPSVENAAISYFTHAISAGIDTNSVPQHSSLTSPLFDASGLAWMTGLQYTPPRLNGNHEIIVPQSTTYDLTHFVRECILIGIKSKQLASVNLTLEGVASEINQTIAEMKERRERAATLKAVRKAIRLNPEEDGKEKKEKQDEDKQTPTPSNQSTGDNTSEMLKDDAAPKPETDSAVQEDKADVQNQQQFLEAMEKFTAKSIQEKGQKFNRYPTNEWKSAEWPYCFTPSLLLIQQPANAYRPFKAYWVRPEVEKKPEDGTEPPKTEPEPVQPKQQQKHKKKKKKFNELIQEENVALIQVAQQQDPEGSFLLKKPWTERMKAKKQKQKMELGIPISSGKPPSTSPSDPQPGQEQTEDGTEPKPPPNKPRITKEMRASVISKIGGGMDVICPSEWAMPLFMAFVSSGAVPFGVDEAVQLELETMSFGLVETTQENPPFTSTSSAFPLLFPTHQPDTFSSARQNVITLLDAMQKEGRKAGRGLHEDLGRWKAARLDSPFVCDWESLWSSPSETPEQASSEMETDAADQNEPLKISELMAKLLQYGSDKQRWAASQSQIKKVLKYEKVRESLLGEERKDVNVIWKQKRTHSGSDPLTDQPSKPDNDDSTLTPHEALAQFSKKINAPNEIVTSQSMKQQQDPPPNDSLVAPPPSNPLIPPPPTVTVIDCPQPPPIEEAFSFYTTQLSAPYPSLSLTTRPFTPSRDTITPVRQSPFFVLRDREQLCALFPALVHPRSFNQTTTAFPVSTLPMPDILRTALIPVSIRTYNAYPDPASPLYILNDKQIQFVMSKNFSISPLNIQQARPETRVGFVVDGHTSPVQGSIGIGKGFVRGDKMFEYLQRFATKQGETVPACVLVYYQQVAGCKMRLGTLTLCFGP
ncbi:putative Ribonucleases P/MRP protein subunit POP1 [Blattamonas nauphoetae]|uniref:Ribonucleases P/MRP protein subunit POP1 n=1 Tax=Blattamonas nauphoetae TaxID=2049346 RepID=A0ABQ9YF48_9EUKA|nr:putative Ribonucleases P/MRP protein subunit POP1 [Blattamonas nauphoetae]